MKTQQGEYSESAVSLDELDRSILYFLDRKGNMTLVDLATKLGVSRQLIRNRIAKMEHSGVIKGYLTIFDSGALGQNWYRALFRLMNISVGERSDFIRFLKENEYVTWLGEVGGRWDIAVNFVARSPMAFNAIYEEISEKFGSLVRDVQILVYVDIHDFSRSYLSNAYVDRKTFFHKMSFLKEVYPDHVDYRLMELISTNARMDISTISRQLNVSRVTVNQRLRHLQESGVILGSRVFIDLKKMGVVSNMLLLEMNHMNKEREVELYLYLRLLPQVTYVVKHLERWKIGMEIETRSYDEFQYILLDIRAKFSDLISDYDTFPILQDHVINYFPKGAFIESES